jgi:hypothetical protein
MWKMKKEMTVQQQVRRYLKLESLVKLFKCMFYGAIAGNLIALALTSFFSVPARPNGTNYGLLMILIAGLVWVIMDVYVYQCKKHVFLHDDLYFEYQYQKYGLMPAKAGKPVLTGTREERLGNLFDSLFKK